MRGAPRRPAFHAGGRGFEPSTAHSPLGKQSPGFGLKPCVTRVTRPAIQLTSLSRSALRPRPARSTAPPPTNTNPAAPGSDPRVCPVEAHRSQARLVCDRSRPARVLLGHAPAHAVLGRLARGCGTGAAAGAARAVIAEPSGKRQRPRRGLAIYILPVSCRFLSQALRCAGRRIPNGDAVAWATCLASCWATRPPMPCSAPGGSDPGTAAAAGAAGAEIAECCLCSGGCNRSGTKHENCSPENPPTVHCSSFGSRPPGWRPRGRHGARAASTNGKDTGNWTGNAGLTGGKRMSHSSHGIPDPRPSRGLIGCRGPVPAWRRQEARTADSPSAPCERGRCRSTGWWTNSGPRTPPKTAAKTVQRLRLLLAPQRPSTYGPTRAAWPRVHAPARR